jgi:hypothetical protein
MRNLVRAAEILNALTRRKLELEAKVRMVTSSTSYAEVVAIKLEHASVVQRIERIEKFLS